MLIVMTIGHSTRPVKEFIHLLKAHQLTRLVDVRTVPHSRHNPQFNRSELPPALHSARLHYSYVPGLGGFRHARRDSLNTGWHNASFRGVADYMQTRLSSGKVWTAAILPSAERLQTLVSMPLAEQSLAIGVTTDALVALLIAAQPFEQFGADRADAQGPLRFCREAA